MEDHTTGDLPLVLSDPTLDRGLPSHSIVVLLTWLEPLVVTAVLGVLLVLRVEIVDGISHDVSRVHGFPEERFHLLWTFALAVA